MYITQWMHPATLIMCKRLYCRLVLLPILPLHKTASMWASSLWVFLLSVSYSLLFLANSFSFSLLFSLILSYFYYSLICSLSHFSLILSLSSYSLILSPLILILSLFLSYSLLFLSSFSLSLLISSHANHSRREGSPLCRRSCLHAPSMMLNPRNREPSSTTLLVSMTRVSLNTVRWMSSIGQTFPKLRHCPWQDRVGGQVLVDESTSSTIQ